MLVKKLTLGLVAFFFLLNVWVPSSVAQPAIFQPASRLTPDPMNVPAIASQEPAAKMTPGSETSLISSTDHGVRLEVQVDWQLFGQATTTSAGATFSQLSMPGWPVMSNPGQPAVPFLVEQIGIPFGVRPSLRVKPGNPHKISLPAPAMPALSQVLDWSLPVAPEKISALPQTSVILEPDPAIYDHQKEFPGELAKITNDGIWRGQRVLGISLYPIQYEPEQQEVTIYSSMHVEVVFSGDLIISSYRHGSESQAYEEVFNNELVNYASARAWRQPVNFALAQTIQSTGDPVTNQAEATPWPPPSPGWRIKVQNEGFYKLNYLELEGAGLPVSSLDPTTFQMFYQGNEIAIQVSGEADHQFNPGDELIFFGQSIQSKYTADNVYWLTYGQASGLRFSTRDGSPGVASTPTFYMADKHFENSQFYLPYAPGTDDFERWFWDYLYPPSRPSWTHNFTLADPYSGAANITVNMLGYIQNPVNPDHHVRVNLNGTQLDELWWDGITWQSVNMSIPPGTLIAGNNTLQVIDVNDTGIGYDVVYIDSVDLEFSNNFTAENDHLTFNYGNPGTWKFQVEGFTNSQLQVFDVTNPSLVTQILNPSVIAMGPEFAVVFEDLVTTSNNYSTISAPGYRTVSAIEEDIASNLQSGLNSADILIITPREFWNEVASLKDFRATQMKALQVDIQDLYDEFGYGITSAQAIHHFLSYAYANWQQPGPSYVMLVGDGHYDPKNFKGFGRTSYIPPYLARLDPWMGETATDNRYVTLAGSDNLPEMMLGRLSVNSASETSIVVNKILAYEQNPPAGDWKQQILAIADNADEAGDFAQYSNDLLSCCTGAPYTTEKVHFGITHTSQSTARAAIQAGINAGKLVVNYIGHAYSLAWADEDLFMTSDVPLLTNGGMQPVVLAMTCRDGYFISPDPLANNQEALAEVVTRANGKGAIASWSPTGLGVSTGHDSLDRGFFEAVFLSGEHKLGKATSSGLIKLWSTGANLDLLDTYLLFGDPALNMQATVAALQTPTNLQASAISSARIDLTWQDNSTSESEFRIERSPDGLTNWQQVGIAPQDSTSYSDMSLSSGTAYYYQVRAYRAGDTLFSYYSEIANATTFSSRMISFNPGWNLFTLPFIPGAQIDAESLLQDIYSQGGTCQEMMEWINGGWNSHERGKPFGNFTLEMGKGYFVRCDQISQWTVDGIRPVGGIGIDLVPGWNLVGIPYPETGYLAHTVLDEITDQVGSCSEIMRWYNSGWESYIPPIPANDFNILSHEGYFLLCSTESYYVPGASPH